MDWEKAKSFIIYFETFHELFIFGAFCFVLCVSLSVFFCCCCVLSLLFLLPCLPLPLTSWLTVSFVTGLYACVCVCLHVSIILARGFGKKSKQYKIKYYSTTVTTTKRKAGVSEWLCALGEFGFGFVSDKAQRL